MKNESEQKMRKICSPKSLLHKLITEFYEIISFFFCFQMKNSSLDPNSQDDHYMVCDIEFEECLLNGTTLYKCSTCGELFTETLLLIDHYSSNHVSKITDLKEVEVTDVIDVCNFTKINDADDTKVRNVTKVSQVTKINNVTEVTNVTKNNDETKVTDKVETVNSFNRVGSVVATENVQSSAKDTILVNAENQETGNNKSQVHTGENMKIQKKRKHFDNQSPVIKEIKSPVNEGKKSKKDTEGVTIDILKPKPDEAKFNLEICEAIDVIESAWVFKCVLCHAVFEERSDMIEHNFKVHEGFYKTRHFFVFRCTMCPKEFKKEFDIVRHVKLVHKVEIIKTDIADLSKTGIEKSVEDDFQSNIESTEMFKDENNILKVTQQEMAVISVTPIINGFKIVPATINQMAEVVDAHEAPYVLTETDVKKVNPIIKVPISQENNQLNDLPEELLIEQSSTNKQSVVNSSAFTPKIYGKLNSDEERIKSKLIFCIICGNNFEELQGLSSHLEVSTKCKTRENLQFLSRHGIQQEFFQKRLKERLEYLDRLKGLRGPEKHHLSHPATNYNNIFKI